MAAAAVRDHCRFLPARRGEGSRARRALHRALLHGVDDDQQFAAGLAANGAVVAAMQLSAEKEKRNGRRSWPDGLPQPGLQVDGLEQWLASMKPRSMVFQSVQPPIPEMYRAVRFFANTNLPADPTDGVYRREPLFAVFDGKVVPSEALAAWLVGHPGAAALSVETGAFRRGRPSRFPSTRTEERSCATGARR